MSNSEKNIPEKISKKREQFTERFHLLEKITMQLRKQRTQLREQIRDLDDGGNK